MVRHAHWSAFQRFSLIVTQSDHSFAELFAETTCSTSEGTLPRQQNIKSAGLDIYL